MWTRRQVLGALGAGSMVAWSPQVAWARGRDPRLVLVMLRGGLDGLHAVPAIGDPSYARARGSLALPAKEVLPLDGMFALHPALAPLHGWWASKELAIVHATSAPYAGRSHFEGQDLLENGTTDPQGARDGWLGRALQSLGHGGVGIGQQLPLVLRGAAASSSVDPTPSSPADARFLADVAQLWEADPTLSAALAQGQQARQTLGVGFHEARRRDDPVVLATAAAKLLREPGGERVSVLDLPGWDTHARQGGVEGSLAGRLRDLAGALTALREGLDSAWSETVVLVVTEFGRTVAANGTGGTDHGVGGVCFVAGGAVAGGRVHGVWPGLNKEALREGRDLDATTDLRAVFKGVLSSHLGVSTAALSRQVFPGSRDVAGLKGLVRT